MGPLNDGQNLFGIYQPFIQHFISYDFYMISFYHLVYKIIKIKTNEVYQPLI
jgi:hypothetical protein